MSYNRHSQIHNCFSSNEGIYRILNNVEVIIKVFYRDKEITMMRPVTGKAYATNTPKADHSRNGEL
jgi:hypothetical protein